ncbi:hypothetical protein R1sor_005906 [Riccia sorocarpa]|uniref:Uncharacterized protein n=1 Tax=Riccia sorocarpa TaxID=122646 RepID=A0ABD3HQ90_9MARC
MKNIMQGWKTCRKNLTLQIEEKSLNSNTPLELLLSMGESYLGGNAGGWKAVKRSCKTMRVRTLGELGDSTLARLSAADTLGHLPDTGERTVGPSSAPIYFIRTWAANSDDQGTSVVSPGFWQLKHDPNEAHESWHRKTKVWRTLLTPIYNLREKMNASWGVSRDTNKWKSLWHQDTERAIGSLARKYTSVGKQKILTESLNTLKQMRLTLASRLARGRQLRQRRLDSEWTPKHQSSQSLEDANSSRLMDRSDAQQGRSLKERQEVDETSTTSQRGSEEPDEEVLQVEEMPNYTMAQELAVLGFTAMEVGD